MSTPRARKARSVRLLKIRAEAEAAGVELHVPAKRQKFHAIKAVYNGQTYDSKGEALYAQKLDQRMYAGEILSWERAPSFLIADSGCKVCGAGPYEPCVAAAKKTLKTYHRERVRLTFKPDFYVVPAKGNSRYVDYKGSRATETAAFNMRVTLWRMHVPYELWVAYESGEEKMVASGEEAVLSRSVLLGEEMIKATRQMMRGNLL